MGKEAEDLEKLAEEIKDLEERQSQIHQELMRKRGDYQTRSNRNVSKFFERYFTSESQGIYGDDSEWHKTKYLFHITGASFSRYDDTWRFSGYRLDYFQDWSGKKAISTETEQICELLKGKPYNFGKELTEITKSEFLDQKNKILTELKEFDF